MRLEGTRLQFGMELHPDEPGMVLIFHNLRQDAVRRKPRETQAMLLEPILVGSVHLIAMAMALRNLGRATINPGNPAAALEHRGIGAKPHGATEITVF